MSAPPKLRRPTAALSLVFFFLFLCPFVTFTYGAATTQSSERTPVQAELLKTIEAGRVQVGEPVYARVRLAWNQPDCKLREGAILKGRVVLQTPRTKAAKSSEIAMVFDTGQCGGRDMKPLPMTVAAVLAPDPIMGPNLWNDQQKPPLSESFGLSLGGPGSGTMRSVTQAVANSAYMDTPLGKEPKTVLPGQVIGLKDLKLNLGKGPEGSSLFTSEKHNLRLESGSRLVLVSNVNASSVTSGNPPSPGTPEASLPETASSAQPVGAELPDESDSCAPPACNVVLNTGLAEPRNDAPDVFFSIQQLGFRGPVDREIYDLAYDGAISYIGAGRLLFTYNPHWLISRTSSDADLPKLHIVHAALIDLGTKKVIRTADWRIHDDRQYLWSMGRDRILVHVGPELRVYDHDLRLDRRIPLNGPLAFLRVSPSGGYLAIGTIRERHSESIHRELVEAEGKQPEEDVEVRVLDRTFQSLVDVMRSSRDAPPVLSDNGEIRVPTIGKNRWRIVEHTWTGQRHILKQVTSTCRPEVSSLPPDLLFVTGCDRLEDGKWYRVLRPDGTLVLKGESASTLRGHTANGIAGSRLFAVGISEATRPLALDSAFHSSELKSLHVGVYAAENGKKLTEVTIPSPLATFQSFALSPDDHAVAVLNSDQITIYPLATPANPELPKDAH